MLEKAHIFNPVNDTLTEKVRAYRSTHQAWLNSEASLKYADDPDWSNTLGERELIEEGNQVAIEGLVQATNALSIEELDRATDQGIMSKEEVSQFMQHKSDRQANLRASNRVNQSRGLKR